MTSGAGRKPWVALVLSVFSSGLGLLYTGRLGWAVAAMVLPSVIFVLATLLGLFVPALQVGAILGGTGVLVASSLLGIVASYVLARRQRTHFEPGPFNRVGVYVAFALVSALWTRGVAWTVRLALVEPFVVPSQSMRPGLLEGDQFFVAKVGPSAAVRHGDIVVVRRPTGSKGHVQDFVRRVVARGGESVAVDDDGVPVVNGHRLTTAPCAVSTTEYVSVDPTGPGRSVVPVQCTRESTADGTTYEVFTNAERAPNPFPPVALAPTQLFLLGDNRDSSHDDRYVGPSEESQLVGRALFVWFSYSAVDGIRWHRIGHRL
jgi:signal peptidase I